MKEELVIIRPIKPGNNQLVCQTIMGDTWYVLSDRYNIYPLSTFDTRPDKKEGVLVINFTDTQKDFKIRFTLDDKPFDAKSYDDPNERDRVSHEIATNKRKRAAVLDFFGRHMQIKQVTPLGNNHQPEFPIFELDFVSQKARIRQINDMTRVEVFNKVMAMDMRELYDLCLYYKPELYNRRRSEILQGLIGLKGIATDQDFGGGVLMKLENAVDFLNNYQSNSNNVIKIFVNKAIQYGIIQRNATGLITNNGATSMGVTVEDAVVFCLRQSDVYTNYIIPEVQKREELPQDDLVYWKSPDVIGLIKSTQQKQEVKEIRNLEYRNNLPFLQDEAKRLGIKNYSQMGEEKLRQKVDEAYRVTKTPAGTPSETLDKAIQQAGIPAGN